MKVLIVIRNSPVQSYLFTVTTKATADEIHGHVRQLSWEGEREMSSHESRQGI